jgi:hypothetical protein
MRAHEYSTESRKMRHKRLRPAAVARRRYPLPHAARPEPDVVVVLLMNASYSGVPECDT